MPFFMQMSLVAFLPERCGAGSTKDSASLAIRSFGEQAGQLYVTGLSFSDAYPRGSWLIRLEGFTTESEILQTFSPSPGVAFRVPIRPEGMAGADKFDTYWGPLTKPLNFTQAHPLQCDYPAAQPHVGDYLTVSDTLPTPAPGSGYYYVTSATYQEQTRYGRKTTNGHLSGRDPALLPVCGP